MYGLLGKTLSHSLSPQIHQHLGSYEYKLFCKEKNELDAFFDSKELDGFNVTIPYKVDAFNYCDKLSSCAEKIGSVNTVIRMNDGTLYGDNTDYFGFEYMAKKCGADFKNKKVIILGSGGASKTVKTVSEDYAAKETVIISRSGENNYENISKNFDADIIVNTTPVGMFPNNGKSVISLKDFKKCSCVLDLIYNPLATSLLIEAESLGIPHSNGLTMLVAQALRSAELFLNKSIPEDNIDKIYNSIIREQKNLVLIGMPGCGKSTVAKLLSEKLKREYIDTDILTEKKCGEDIPSVFKKYGEKYFRKIESDAVSEAGKQLGKVIATGGGAVMTESNRNALMQNGIIVFLNRDTDKLASGGRPLSKDKETLKKMYDERYPVYNQFCDYTVPVSDDADETCERVIKCIFS